MCEKHETTGGEKLVAVELSELSKRFEPYARCGVINVSIEKSKYGEGGTYYVKLVPGTDDEPDEEEKYDGRTIAEHRALGENLRDTAEFLYQLSRDETPAITAAFKAARPYPQRQELEDAAVTLECIHSELSERFTAEYERKTNRIAPTVYPGIGYR